MMPKLGDSNCIEKATRTELIQKVKDLENMAKDFYKFATEKLLNEIENMPCEEENKMEDTWSSRSERIVSVEQWNFRDNASWWFIDLTL